MNLLAVHETTVQSLSQEDPLQKGMATHSSFLAWRIPWTEEPSRLQSMELQKVRHDWATNTFSWHFGSFAVVEARLPSHEVIPVTLWGLLTKSPIEDLRPYSKSCNNLWTVCGNHLGGGSPACQGFSQWQPQPTPWQQLQHRTAQLSFLQIPDSQEMWGIMFYCYFKLQA